MTQAVLHVDADAFFASVEQLDQPQLLGVPVLVGGLGGRGVAASVSREAKRLGARSAMPMGQAKARCGPHHVVVSPRFARYQEVSRAMVAVFDAHATVVEQVSIDEAWLELPPGVDPAAAAHAVIEDVLGRVGITVSVGAATTLVCSKMLSTWTKAAQGPGTYAWLGGSRQERMWMAAQPVRALPGVGPVTAATLAEVEVATVADLLAVPERLLQKLVGKAATRSLLQLGRNDDPRRPDPSGERKQVSSERTLRTNITELDELVTLAGDTATGVARAISSRGGGARTITVKLRSDAFVDVSRSRTLDAPTDEEGVMVAVAHDLVRVAHAALEHAPVRLVGVSASGLTTSTQPTLDLDLS